MAKYATNALGFGTPGFISPAQGSGVRFGKFVPKRSRLVRLRGLGDYYPYESEFPTDDYYAGVNSQASAPTSVPPTGSIWTITGASSGAAATVAAQGGGTTQVSQSWLRDITDLLRAGQQAVAQQRILDINMQRAQQGLPLIDPRNFSPSAAVNFGLTPQAAQMLLIGGAALLALMMLRKK